MTCQTSGGEILGIPGKIPDDGRIYLHNQRLGKVVVKRPNLVDCGFLYWLFLSSTFNSDLATSASGTKILHTSPARIEAFQFALPPLAEQRAIAHILSTLDDKIELNRRMNVTLEEMARALFKSWFVNFDPVRAKVEGGSSSLRESIADFFPDSFEESTTGEIPTGWALTPFAATVEIMSGGTPQTSFVDYWNGEIPWFSVVDAPKESDVWVIETQKKITQAGVDNSSARILPVGTTIISARGTVGRVAMVGVPMAMNQSCYGLRGVSGNRGTFTYFSTRQLVSLLQQHAHGSVFSTITRETFMGVEVPSPPKSLVETFEETVEPIVQRIRTALFESRALAAMRDALLPKLISRKLRIEDAEHIVGRSL
jgi:type I restriction enzyme S subunit